jgi:hypothetical protein
MITVGSPELVGPPTWMGRGQVWLSVIRAAGGIASPLFLVALVRVGCRAEPEPGAAEIY